MGRTATPIDPAEELSTSDALPGDVFFPSVADFSFVLISFSVSFFWFVDLGLVSLAFVDGVVFGLQQPGQRFESALRKPPYKDSTDGSLEFEGSFVCDSLNLHLRL